MNMCSKRTIGPYLNMQFSSLLAFYISYFWTTKKKLHSFLVGTLTIDSEVVEIILQPTSAVQPERKKKIDLLKICRKIQHRRERE